MAEQDAGRDVAKVADAIKSSGKIAMLTSRDPDGTLMSRPMAVQEAEFDGDLWFVAERSSRTVDHIGSDPQVNVAFSSETSWVSLTGYASVVEDDARKDELWNTTVEAWFPEGKDSDEVILLRVEADSAELWEGPGRVATLLSLAKAKATGERFEGGENERVEL